MLFRTTVLFALASTALAVEAQMLRSSSIIVEVEEPKAESLIEPVAYDAKELYMKQEEEPKGESPVAYDAKELYMKQKVAATTATQTEGNGEGKKGSFGIKKGIKCTGGFDTKKGMKKHCEGGMEKDFSMSFTTSDMKDELGSDLLKQLQDFMPEPEMLIGMSDEEMEAHLFGDEEEEDDVAVSKTVEFGGVMKAEWGCKVTFEKSAKGISKKVECGAKFDAGSGKKEMAEGTSVLGYFN